MADATRRDAGHAKRVRRSDGEGKPGFAHLTPAECDSVNMADDTIARHTVARSRRFARSCQKR